MRRNIAPTNQDIPIRDLDFGVTAVGVGDADDFHLPPFANQVCESWSLAAPVGFEEQLGAGKREQNIVS